MTDDEKAERAVDGLAGKLRVTRLFNDDYETYTNAGNDLEEEVRLALKPIIDKAEAKGYSLRDVGSIIAGWVGTEISTHILMRRVWERDRERQAKAVR